MSGSGRIVHRVTSTRPRTRLCGPRAAVSVVSAVPVFRWKTTNGGRPLSSEYAKWNDEDRLNETLHRAKKENWTKRQFDNEWIWGAILRHPDGPAEFPLDQIMAFRWYEPAQCPLRGVNPVELFPQLRAHNVKIHRCPQCARTFAAVDGFGAAEPFANHLRIMHEYDMVNILNFGERIGIDFTGVEYGTEEAKELTFGEAEEDDALRCEECGLEFKGKMAAARLAKHAKEHPAFELEPA